MPAELQDIDAIPGFDSTPSIDADTVTALDAMFKEVEENTESEENIEPKSENKVEVAVVDKAEVKSVEGQPVAEEVKSVETAKTDELDAITVPPHTKPKTGEAFDTVKKIAREKIAAVEKRAAELETANKALEEKAKNGMPPETKAELEELRTFRKRMDVESDPEFKAFDARVVTNTETIYSKLTAAGVPAESIAKIKELGGPAGVDWEPILAKLPSVTRRIIESKLVENDDIAEQKSVAIKKAKENADEFLKTRATQTEGQRKDLQTRAEKTLAELLPSFDWLKPKTVDVKATPAQKAEAEAHNTLVKESEQYVKEAIADDSPEMRATLAMAGPELFRARHELAELKASSESQIKKLTEDLTAANGLLEKVKKGSTTRLRTSSAEGKSKAASNETAEDALDRLFKEAQAGEP